MKNTMVLLLVSLLLICQSCKKDENNFYEGVFGFDVVGAGQSVGNLKSSLISKSSEPFCSLDKFEIELLYIFVILADDDIENPSYYTLLSRKHNEGVKVDLANQKLSDVIDLSIENPDGLRIRGFTIGLEKEVVVNGYIDSLGTTYKTTANGIIAGGDQSEDFTMELSSDQAWWELYSGDPDYPLPDENIFGFSLYIAESDNIEPIMLAEGSMFELKWLLDIAIVNDMNDGIWKIGSSYFTTPFIDGQYDYEIYHLRRKDSLHYTNIMSAIFDKSGNINGGGINIGAIIQSADNVLEYMSGWGCDDTGGEIGTYEENFKKNADGSIWFKVDVGGPYNAVFPAFRRENHSGIIEIEGRDDVEYECILIK